MRRFLFNLFRCNVDFEYQLLVGINENASQVLEELKKIKQKINWELYCCKQNQELKTVPVLLNKLFEESGNEINYILNPKTIFYPYDILNKIVANSPQNNEILMTRVATIDPICCDALDDLASNLYPDFYDFFCQNYQSDDFRYNIMTSITKTVYHNIGKFEEDDDDYFLRFLAKVGKQYNIGRLPHCLLYQRNFSKENKEGGGKEIPFYLHTNKFSEALDLCLDAKLKKLNEKQNLL